MKKILATIFISLIPIISFAGAPIGENTNIEASDVIATKDSGTYNSAIKVKLIPNDDNAKIFYYTDHVGRFDEQIEYKLGSEILIKKDTTLNYHSVSDNNTASLIKENIYKFNYPKNLEIFYENQKIIIKNNEDNKINLGYRKIGDFEIPENTIISPNNTYVYEKILKKDESISLISPDEKVKKYFKYETKEEKTITKNKKNKDTIKEQKDDTKEKIVDETKIIKEKNTKEDKTIKDEIKENTGFINTKKTEFKNTQQTGNDTELNSAKTENTNSNLNNNLKTSVIDKKEDKNNNFIILVILFFIIGIIGGIFYEKQKRSV